MNPGFINTMITMSNLKMELYYFGIQQTSAQLTVKDLEFFYIFLKKLDLTFFQNQSG